MGVSDDILNYLKTYGGDAIKTALGSLPGGQAAADVVSNAGPLMDKAAQNPIVQSMAKGATGQDLAPGIPNPGNPLSGIGEGAVVGALTPSESPEKPSSGVSGSWEAPTLPDTQTPLESNPPSSSAIPAVSDKVTPSPPAPVEPSPLLPTDHTEDKRRREANDAALEHKRRMGLIGAGIAGLGDTIASSAKAYGVNNATDTASKLIEQGREQAKEGKAGFDLKIKQDPNSDVSQAYRRMVAQIVPDIAKSPEFMKMSAQDIGDKLPMIDTMMKAQSAKDAKEMGLAQIKENQIERNKSKDLALSEKEEQFNQRRWERFGAAVNPMNAGSRRALGVAAVNNMRADRLLSTAGNKKITSQDYSNLVADLQGIYKGGVPDQVMLKHGDYPSIQRKAGEILSMITGNPKGVDTPGLKEHLTSLTRELKAIDNKVINDNMGFNRVIFSELEEKDPEKFRKAMESLSEMSVGAADVPAEKISGTKPKLSKDSLGLF